VTPVGRRHAVGADAAARVRDALRAARLVADVAREAARVVRAQRDAVRRLRAVGGAAALGRADALAVARALAGVAVADDGGVVARLQIVCAAQIADVEVAAGEAEIADGEIVLAAAAVVVSARLGARASREHGRDQQGAGAFPPGGSHVRDQRIRIRAILRREKRARACGSMRT